MSARGTEPVAINGPPRGFTPARRTLLVFVLVSFAFSCCQILFGASTPRMTPDELLEGFGTDHVSHQGAAILFWYHGWDIYRHPVEELLERDRSPSAERYAAAENLYPDELFRLPERARPDVPLFLNWPELARVYPPGVYLYTLPEALAREWTDWPSRVINGFSIVKYLLAGHLLLWYFLDTLLLGCGWSRVPYGEVRGRFVCLLAFFVQTQVCVWSLNGFYDALAVLFLVLSLRAWRFQGDAAAGMFWYALAVFCHYRSLWYLPLVLAAVLHSVWHDRNALWADHRCRVLLILASLLLLASAVFFVIAYPAMTRFPLDNPLHFRTVLAGEGGWLPLVPVGVVTALVLRREWPLLIGAAGACLFLLNTPQVQYWHSLFLLPLVLCPREYSLGGLLTGCLAYAGLSWAFLGILPLHPTWLRTFYIGR